MKRICISLLLLSLAAPAIAAPIEGRWQNPKDSVIVDVARCGPATWCGRVSWATAKAKADARKSGTANLIGSRLLSGLRADGKGGYKGRVFLPKRRIHAGANVRVAGGGTLIVKGCAVAGMICKEQRWTRVN